MELIAIFFFLSSFTYWAYKRAWKPKMKIGFILVFWLLIISVVAINTQRKETTPRPTTEIPTIPIIPKNYLDFDKKMGNNYFSAKYAQEYMDLANQKAPGVIKNVYLELLSVDSMGIFSQISLKIEVNPFFWNIADNPTKIKLLTVAINELKNTFSGLPHITITDGTKTLATASLPSLTSEPKITLK